MQDHTLLAFMVILQQLKMDVMRWSSKSTDLNPIEHVCNEPNEDLKQPTPLVDLRQA
jgi:hypothetical protein